MSIAPWFIEGEPIAPCDAAAVATTTVTDLYEWFGGLDAGGLVATAQHPEEVVALCDRPCLAAVRLGDTGDVFLPEAAAAAFVATELQLGAQTRAARHGALATLVDSGAFHSHTVHFIDRFGRSVYGYVMAEAE